MTGVVYTAALFNPMHMGTMHQIGIHTDLRLLLEDICRGSKLGCSVTEADDAPVYTQRGVAYVPSESLSTNLLCELLPTDTGMVKSAQIRSELDSGMRLFVLRSVIAHSVTYGKHEGIWHMGGTGTTVVHKSRSYATAKQIMEQGDARDHFIYNTVYGYLSTVPQS